MVETEFLTRLQKRFGAWTSLVLEQSLQKTEHFYRDLLSPSMSANGQPENTWMGCHPNLFFLRLLIGRTAF